jgi:hypothetical protein
MHCLIRRAQVICFLALTAAVTLFPLGAAAQLNSVIANVALSATKGESLTVTVTAGSTVSFDLSTTVANGSVPVTIQTTWVISPARLSVSLYGYFDTATAALTDGLGNNIPSANVKGRMTTGAPTTFTTVTQSPVLGTAGASVILFTEVILGTNKNKTRSDNLDLQIDQTGLTLPAGTYTGTLRLQAQAL